jgi:hypothetical protein
MDADQAARINSEAHWHARRMLECVAVWDLDAARHHRRTGLALLLSLHFDPVLDRRIAEAMRIRISLGGFNDVS